MHRFISGHFLLLYWSNMSVFMPVQYCFDYYTFVIYFEIKTCGNSSFFFLSIVLAIWDLVWCHMNFKIFFFSFHENVFEILILILTLLFWLKPPVLKYWKETFLFIPNLRRKHLVFHHRVILGVGFYTCFLWVLRSFFLYLAFKDYF